MSMGQDELALVKAIESGDTDLGNKITFFLVGSVLSFFNMETDNVLVLSLSLVYHVILYLKRKHKLGDFFRIINNKPLACHLLESYCKQQDPELLKDFYYQDDRRVDSANLSLIESFQQKDPTERTKKLKSSLKLYLEDKEHAFEVKVWKTIKPSNTLFLLGALFDEHCSVRGSHFWQISCLISMFFFF